MKKIHITNDEMLKQMGFGQNAIGAIPIGTKVIKTNSEEGDGNPDGAEAIVAGSMDIPKDLIVGKIKKYSYFIHFLHMRLNAPAVFIMDYKIKIK